MTNRENKSAFPYKYKNEVIEMYQKYSWRFLLLGKVVHKIYEYYSMLKFGWW